MQVTHGDDGHRQPAHHNNLPTELRIGARRVQVLEWSAQGLLCTCRESGEPLPAGPVGIRLELPVGDIGFVFHATIRQGWRHGDLAQFSFVALPDDARELLKKYTGVDARKGTGGAPLGRQVPGVRLPQSGTDSPDPAKEQKPAPARTGRPLFAQAFGLVALAWAAFFLYRTAMVDVSLLGVVSGTAVAAVAPQSRTVTSVDVAEGQQVAAGQVIARLDDAELRRDIAQAQLQAEDVRQRMQALTAQLAQRADSLERQALAVWAARMEALRKREAGLMRHRDALVTRLEDCIVRAPAAGIITTLLVRPGEQVEVGRSVATIAAGPQGETSRQYVLASFARQGRIAVGDRALVRIPSRSLALPGRVVALGDQALGPAGLLPLERGTTAGSTTVQVALDANPPLPPGLLAEVDVPRPWREWRPQQ